MWSTSSVGGSVASPREAKVSIIKLSQSIYTGFNGDSSKKAQPTNVKTIAAMVAVI